MKGKVHLNIASIDLEINENNDIYSIGATHNYASFCKKGRFVVAAALVELDEFVSDSSFILGHNLLHHDLPLLKQLSPDLTLHTKPVIDTLFFPH